MRLLTAKEVVKITTLSRVTIWRHVQAGIFPAPIKLGPKRIAWLHEDIEGWINNRAGKA